MNRIILLAVIVTLAQGFAVDFFSAVSSSLERIYSKNRDALSLDAEHRAGENKFVQHTCLENMHRGNNISAIPVFGSTIIDFKSKNYGQSNYPANYSCGAFFMGRMHGKRKNQLTLNCGGDIASGDYIIVIGHDYQKVYTKGFNGIYKKFEKFPMFYLGFVSNTGGAKGFRCNVYTDDVITY